MVSLRAYARHRGCTLEAVRCAIRDGRLAASLTRDHRGKPKIADVTHADEEWRLTTRAEYVPHSVRSREADVPAPYTTAGIPTLAASRARHEAAKAEKAELELAKFRGDLVSAAAVEARWTDIITVCRSKLLSVPGKAKSLMPHLTHEDVALLDELQREALEELAAAGGSARPSENGGTA